jgi:hypothetical protein
VNRRAFLAVAACFALLIPATSPAVTRLEGEYQLMLDLRKSDRPLSWDFDSNDDAQWTGAQLRFFTTPRRNTEAFFKVESDWKKNTPVNNGRRPIFLFREAHLRYQWDVGPGRGVESFLFFRQDRFWADSYLIPLVETGAAKNDDQGPNGSGIRVNTWGLLGGNATFIASDFAGQISEENWRPERTDDAYIARLRREFLDRKLRLGLGFNRKVENEQVDAAVTSTSVYAADARYQWNNVDYSLEYAFSDGPPPPVASPERWSGRISQRAVLQGEIRSFRLGNAAVGFVNFVPAGWIKGPLYRNELDFSERDEVAWKLDTWYLVPQRAITLTGSYVQGLKTATQEERWSTAYLEAYIEFVKGFTGKVSYKSSDNRRFDGTRRILNEDDDLFGEVQVESRLAWMRLQGKVRDINLPEEKVLLNLDTSINLSDRLKVYNRFSFGSDPAILRKGIFSQLQYRPTGNVEMFLEYGPNYIGDGSVPVDDGDLSGNADQTDLLKFIIKGQF